MIKFTISLNTYSNTSLVNANIISMEIVNLQSNLLTFEQAVKSWIDENGLMCADEEVQWIDTTGLNEEPNQAFVSTLDMDGNCVHVSFVKTC